MNSIAIRRGLLTHAKCAGLLCVALLLGNHASLAQTQTAAVGTTGPGLSPRDVELLGKSAELPGMLASGTLEKSDIPNPHWQPKGCIACHSSRPSGNVLNLRATDALSGCKDCHDSITEQTHIHAVGMIPPSSFLTRMPSAFRATLTAHEERINCLTCHDVVIQCHSGTYSQAEVNPNFLRGAPYNTRTGICYQCHDRSKYQPLNPHDQVDEKGEILTDKCLICHLDVPKELANGEVTNAALYLDQDRAALCINCHRKIPHPSGNLSFISKGEPDHLVKPDAKFRQHMVKMSEENNVYLPLEEGSGQIYCATCHNPHERGVLKNKRYAMGADSENRLRTVPLCINCHDI